MEQNSEKVTCPNCGYEIDVNEILYHQLEEKLKKEFNAKLAEQKKDLKEKEDAIDKQRGETKNNSIQFRQKLSLGLNTICKRQKKNSNAKCGLKRKRNNLSG